LKEIIVMMPENENTPSNTYYYPLPARSRTRRAKKPPIAKVVGPTDFDFKQVGSEPAVNEGTLSNDKASNVKNTGETNPEPTMLNETISENPSVSRVKQSDFPPLVITIKLAIKSLGEVIIKVNYPECTVLQQ
jgi:hypothetical protein